jgi:hypothetical protein
VFDYQGTNQLKLKHMFVSRSPSKMLELLSGPPRTEVRTAELTQDTGWPGVLRWLDQND